MIYIGRETWHLFGSKSWTVKVIFTPFQVVQWSLISVIWCGELLQLSSNTCGRVCHTLGGDEGMTLLNYWIDNKCCQIQIQVVKMNLFNHWAVTLTPYQGVKLGSGTGLGIQSWLRGSLCTSESRWWWIHPGFETHKQSQPKSKQRVPVAPQNIFNP